MQPTYSLFPKLYADLSPTDLVHLVRLVGLDSVNVVIRKGYWVDEDNIRDDLARFLSDTQAEGLAVTRAETTLSADLLLSSDSPFPILRDAGIREFRMGWFPRSKGDVRGDLDHARMLMELVASAAERYQVKAIYQVHHRTLVTNPTTAYHLVRGLNPRWVGIEIDPGNQSFEGYEPWDHVCGLLRSYVAWVGVKDTRTWQEIPRSEEAGKGWDREFCPLQEGVTNWQDLVHSLTTIAFDGTFIFMPFYDEHDARSRTAKLKGEVEYLRAIVDSTRPLRG